MWDIYSPLDYVNIVKVARTKPGPYEVRYLKFDVFRDFEKFGEGEVKSLKPGKDEFVSGRTRHEDLWAKILAKLQAAGFWGKTAMQVNTKWSDLKKTYRKTKDNNRSTGRARKDFAYEDEMDEFMGEKASTNPQVLIDSRVPKADVGEKRANCDPATPKPDKKPREMTVLPNS